MEELKLKVCSNRLYEVVSVLVVEEGSTIQIAKNRMGNKVFNEIKNLDFVTINKDDVKNCDNILEKYHGKNVWYVI